MGGIPSASVPLFMILPIYNACPSYWSNPTVLKGQIPPLWNSALLQQTLISLLYNCEYTFCTHEMTSIIYNLILQWFPGDSHVTCALPCISSVLIFFLFPSQRSWSVPGVYKGLGKVYWSDSIIDWWRNLNFRRSVREKRANWVLSCLIWFSDQFIL